MAINIEKAKNKAFKAAWDSAREAADALADAVAKCTEWESYAESIERGEAVSALGNLKSAKMKVATAIMRMENVR